MNVALVAEGELECGLGRADDQISFAWGVDSLLLGGGDVGCEVFGGYRDCLPQLIDVEVAVPAEGNGD